MNVLTGNAREAETRGTGWFLGFSDWTLSEGSGLLHVPKEKELSGLCIKWYQHPSGDRSGTRPVSEGRTISLLVSTGSLFELQFSLSPGFGAGRGETVLLRRHGDFAAWGPGIFHRWRCIESSTVLTVRWKMEDR